MGHNKRRTPAKLGKKLKAIRDYLELTQEQMIERLDCPLIPLNKGSISNYEKNIRAPAIIVILKYARLVKVPVEVLLDDELDLQLK